MSEILTFSLKRDFKEVQLLGEDGVLRKYTIRDMTGGDRDLWTGYLVRKAREAGTDSEGKPKNVPDSSGVSSFLLSLTLFDEKEKPVKEIDIKAWPSKVVESLAGIARDLCGLTQEAANALGNASEASGSNGSASPPV